MIDRTQRILLTALAVQLVLILVVWAPWSSDAGATASQELFPELDSDGIARIEIEQADGRVTLSRGPEGWTVDERASFPADSDRVGELIEDVAEVRTRVPVVRSSRYHDALGVGDREFEARVRLTGEGGENVVADVMLGTSPNVGLRHLRLADDDLGDHHLADREGEDVLVAGCAAHDVTLGDDADAAGAVVGDDQRADVVLREQGDDVAHGLFGSYGNNVRTFGRKNVVDLHILSL